MQIKVGFEITYTAALPTPMVIMLSIHPSRYADIEEDLVLIGVLKGAIMFMTDFARSLPIPSQMEFMAVSSYGSSTSSSDDAPRSSSSTAAGSPSG